MEKNTEILTCRLQDVGLRVKQACQQNRQKIVELDKKSVFGAEENF